MIRRYQSQRTNFATYEEDMTEFPTVVTWISYDKNVPKDPEPNLKHGENYHIHLFKKRTFFNSTKLRFGKNVIKQTNLRLDFKPLLHNQNVNAFKITPLNFTPGLVWKDVHYSLDLEVVYSFKNVSQWSDPKVAIK